MKDTYRQISLSRFCRLLGVTRQAYYQHFWQEEFIGIEHNLVLQEVQRIRSRHRHMGGRKLHEMLQPYFMEHQIKMGRDALFDLLESNHLLVRRKKRRVYTTQSFHWLRKYPNLIKGQQLVQPNQLWVSDITYWRIGTGYVYISLITDAFSHKIVGYHVADTLETVQTLAALKMAIQTLPENHHGLTHHSDRGIQYCSSEYVQMLQQYNIQISMTENGDPRENAIAERVNGILKEEYLYDYSVQTLSQARLVLDFVINLYNVERPHMSCQYKTPETVHQLR
jgi:transposase InsO family protein